MNRRNLAVLAGAMVTATVTPAAPSTIGAPGSARFDAAMVPALARERASQPHRPRQARLPRGIDALDYDGYRGIRFRPEHALWADAGLGFRLQPHHRGFLFKDRVDIFEVADGNATPLRYNPDQFTFDGGAPPADIGDIGFAGFRILSPLNRADHFDELCSFLGASYFRGLGRGHAYGLSARALAIRTAHQAGEEFPAFTAFWIERPQPGAPGITIHALLESASVVGAYRFMVTPGADTVMDVTAELFPRVDMDRVGIAPGTSMFMFGPGDRRGVSDFRPAVHDSDGLLMRTGGGDTIWRPLANPRALQVSGFQDRAPRGFGLMQRSRAFVDFQDLEAAYHRRPGLWVEPLDDWGEGEVQLVEIPTRTEIHDNIVAAWVPRGGLRAGQVQPLRYRLHWVSEAPTAPPVLRFAATRAGGGDGTVRFVLDTTRTIGTAAAMPQPVVTSSAGRIENIVVQANPETGGLRLGFELRPEQARLAELQAMLAVDGRPVSERWVFRWTG